MLLRQHPARTIAVLLVCLVVLGTAGALAALARLPRPIRTHNDAVAYALQQRSIAYTKIQLTSTLAGIPGYNHFPGERHPFAVQIRLSDGSIGQGVLDCDSSDNECVLTVAKLKLAGVSVPNRSAEHIWPLWGAINTLIQRIGHSFGDVH